MSGLSGQAAWDALEANYPRVPASKVPSLAAAILISALIMILSVLDLRSSAPLMTVWSWLACALVGGFVTFYIMNGWLECKEPKNKLYCDARKRLEMGETITSHPSVVGIVGV